METKTQTAINLLNKGQMKQSLAIFKTFRLGISKEEKRVIEIAYESMTGKAMYYEQLGISTLDMIDQAVEIINRKYIRI